MIVQTTRKIPVVLVNTDGKSLFDNNGTEWERCPEYDDKDAFLLGYRENKNHVQVIQLTREEIKRVINGVHAMMTPITVDEMRFYVSSLPKRYQEIADQWNNQVLREILIEAEERNHNPGKLLESKIYSILKAEEDAQRAKEEQEREEIQKKAQEKPEKVHSVSGGYKSTSKRRTQEGSISVVTGDMSIVLTPKQLEFMERLSECPGWNENGVNGEYIASQYSEELSDTMNPMSMGAVLTTLREKRLIVTIKVRIGGIKCCMFKLTETGVAVYNKLACREVSE